MKNFKNLTDLVEATTQITLQDIINNQAYFNGEGWQKFELDHDLKIQIIDSVVELLGGWNKNKLALKASLMCYHEKPQHWGLRRIFVDKKGRFSYCAGQDYTYELKQIRDYLRK